MMSALVHNKIACMACPKRTQRTVTLQDLTRDVLRIDAIPSTSLDSVREWLQSMDVKFYENKINLNWKPILKSILEVRLP